MSENDQISPEELAGAIQRGVDARGPHPLTPEQEQRRDAGVRDFTKNAIEFGAAVPLGALGAGAGVVAGLPAAASALLAAGTTGAGTALIERAFGGDQADQATAFAGGALGELGGRAMAPAVGAVANEAGRMVGQGVERIFGKGAADYLRAKAARLYRPWEFLTGETPLRPGVVEAQRRLAKFGATLAPDQAVDNSLIEYAGMLTRYAPLSRGMRETQIKGATEAAERGIKDYVDQIVGNTLPSERAALLQDTFRGAGKLRAAVTVSKFRDIDAATGGVRAVDLQPVIDGAKALRQRLLDRGSAEDSQAIAVLNDFLAPIAPDTPIPGLAKPPVTTSRELGETTVADAGSRLRSLQERVAQGGRPLRERTLEETTTGTPKGPDGQQRDLSETVTRYPGAPARRVERDPQATFEDAHWLRSHYANFQAGLADNSPGATRKVVGWLASAVDGQMQVAGRTLPGPPGFRSAMEAYAAARGFAEQGHRLFDSSVMTNWINSETPSVLLDAVKNTPVEDLKRVVQAITEHPNNVRLSGANPATVAAAEQSSRDALDTLIGSTMKQVLFDVGEPTQVGGSVLQAGGMTGRSLGEHLRTFAGPQDERLKALMPQSWGQRFLELVHDLKLAEGGPRGGMPGQLSIQQRSMSSMIALASLPLAAAGVSGYVNDGFAGATSRTGKVGIPTAMLIVLTPRLLGRVMTDRAATEALINGLKAPVGTKTAARAMGQLVAQFARIGVLDQPGTHIPLPIPSAGQPPSAERDPKSAEDILRWTIYDKNQKGRADSILKVWEAAAAGLPE